MPKLVTWMNNQQVGELTNTRRRNRNASDNGMGKAY